MKLPPPLPTEANYKPIGGFPGYIVGDDGSIWCCRSRNGKGGQENSWRRLSPKPRSVQGHLAITLHNGDTSSRKKHYVHRLVLEAFVGPCPDGHLVRHFPDQNPANNSLSNICWGTPKENAADRAYHGNHRRGVDAEAKITEEDVRAIRQEAEIGLFTQKEIGARRGISASQVGRIVQRKRWAHVS